MPSISVITVTFNAATVLPGLIESLQSQSDKGFEWVVVDGASSDGTVNIISSITDLNAVWVSEPDFGIYDAMNKAIRMASGEYYLVLGADDRLESNAIEKFRMAAARNNADLITAWVLRDGKLDRGRPALPWLYAMHAYVVNHSVALLIRKSLHEKFGYYSKRFPVGADMHFIKRVCRDTDTSVIKVPFLAGTFGSAGVSSADKAAAYCDYFRVQLETEERKFIQILLFTAKLLYNSFRLARLFKKSRV
jgi:glycosyltransferase involved in cell wall biosynthesis